MVLCFCNKPSKAATDETASTPVLPARPPPAKLVKRRADVPSDVESSSTTRIWHHTGSVAKQTSIPKDSRANNVGELPENDEADRDDGIRNPADTADHASAFTTAPGLVDKDVDKDADKNTDNDANKVAYNGTDIDVDLADSGSISSFGSLVNRFGSLHRSSSSESNRCRAVDTNVEQEDFAVVARRAEVRRRTQKLIQDELQQEQRSPVPRSYKRSAMSTIKEDPSDMPTPSMATTAVFGSDSIVLVNSGDGHAGDKPSPSGVDNNTGKLGLPARPQPALPPPARAFSLQPSEASTKTEPSGSSAMRGLRGRFRDTRARTSKNWKWASLVAAQPRRVPSTNTEVPAAPTATLPTKTSQRTENATLAVSKEEAQGLGDPKGKECSQNGSSLGDSSPVSRFPFAPLSENTRTAHLHAISDSLSSVDEDGSIHEALEAQVVSRAQANSAQGHAGAASCDDLGKTDTKRADQRPSLLLNPGTCDAKHMRGPSVVSETSRISSLLLPPPMVNLDLSGSDVGVVQPVVAQKVTAVAGFSKPPEPLAAKSEHLSDDQALHTPTSRKGLMALKFVSFRGRNIINGLKKPATTQVTAVSPALTVPTKLGSPKDGASRPASFVLGGSINLKEIPRAPLDVIADLESHPSDSKRLSNEEYGTPRLSNLEKLPSLVEEALKPLTSSSALALEKMAETWHREIEELHVESLEAQHLLERKAKNGQYKSQTCPPAFQATASTLLGHAFKEPSHGDTMSLGGKSKAPSLNKPGPTAATYDIGCIRGHSLDAPRLPESWWSMSVNASVQNHLDLTSARSIDHDCPKNQPGQDGLSKNDATLSIDSDNSRAEVVSLTALESTATSSSRLEKILRNNLQKFLSRKQMAVSRSSSKSSVKQNAATQMPSVDHAETVDQKLSNGEAKLSSVHGPDNVTLDRELATGDGDKKRDGTSQDFNSVFRVIANMSESQDKTVVATLLQQRSQSPEDKTGGPGLAESQRLQLTAPSTPVTEAYAKVHAYMIGTAAENRTSHATRQFSSCSSSSSYRDAVAHIAEPEPPQRVKPGDSHSVKSAALPVTRPFDMPPSPSKYMTWSGANEMPTELMMSTLDFGSELEKIMRGEETVETFTSRVLGPMVKHG